MAGHLYYVTAVLLLDVVICAGSLCPDGSKPVTCIKEPCLNQSCPKHPISTCRNDYCGGCFARFFVNGTDVTHDCKDSQGSLCPDGSLPVQCFKEPCQDEYCFKHPESVCKNDYCGGCYARFWLGDTEVTNDCSATKSNKCPDGSDPVVCKDPSCLTTPCRNHPGSTCVNDYCRGCTGRYFANGVEVTANCYSETVSYKCPDGNDPVNCKVQPCLTTKCPSYPDSICVDDYCGGCNARFFYKRREVTANCNPCRSPPVNQCPVANRVQCLYSPCHVTKTSCYIPNALCFDDLCDGCHARWFLSDCTEVTSQCGESSK